MPASADPTLLTKGMFSVGLKLDYNATAMNGSNRTGMSITAEPIAYGPPTEPPPPWTNGQQYYSGNGTAYGAMGVVATYQSGIYYAFWINDMSSNMVVTGKTYALPFSLGSKWIQLYVRVTGGPNGSTVLPGFGLWSLGTNPHAWTYVTPEAFTGEWVIGLLSPRSFNVMWLSAEYAPPKDYGGTSPEARLTFTVSGLSATDYYQAASRRKSDDPATAEQNPVYLQYLHEQAIRMSCMADPAFPWANPAVSVDLQIDLGRSECRLFAGRSIG